MQFAKFDNCISEYQFVVCLVGNKHNTIMEEKHILSQITMDLYIKLTCHKIT